MILIFVVQKLFLSAIIKSQWNTFFIKSRVYYLQLEQKMQK